MKGLNTLVFVVVAAHAHASGEMEFTQARAQLMELAGVVREPSTAPSESSGRIETPSFPGGRWRRPAGSSSAVRFAPIVGFDTLSETPRAAPTDAFLEWSSALGASSWPQASRELVLRQVGGSRVARGELVLELPAELRATLASATIQDVQSGCAMELGFPLPFVLDAQPRVLSFRWDLSNPIEFDGLHLNFVSPDATLAQIPIRLEAPAEPLVLSPNRLRLIDSDVARVVVSTRSGERLAIRKITCPPCVAVAGAEDDGADVILSFKETELARRRHACGRIEVEVVCDGDPGPIQRFCSVEHGPECVDSAGRSVLRAIVGAGEHFELARRRNGGFALVFGDRLPELAVAHPRWGLETLATLQAPVESGPFERVVYVDGDSVVLVGRVISIPERRADAWRKHCAR